MPKVTSQSPCKRQALGNVRCAWVKTEITVITRLAFLSAMSQNRATGSNCAKLELVQANLLY